MNRIELEYTKEEIQRILDTGESRTVRGDTTIVIRIPMEEEELKKLAKRRGVPYDR